jgi:hypothetical protein
MTLQSIPEPAARRFSVRNHGKTLLVRLAGELAQA